MYAQSGMDKHIGRANEEYYKIYFKYLYNIYRIVGVGLSQ